MFLRKQLAYYQERGMRPRGLTDAARLSLVLWSRLFNWREALVIVSTATFIGWHRKAFKFYGRWKSRGGRPALPIAPEVFALPGELSQNAGFRMAICLDELQQISQFDGSSVENAIRNETQKQRQVGCVFAGSQPTLMEEMLSAKRPFHKAGPKMFLDKISSID